MPAPRFERLHRAMRRGSDTPEAGFTLIEALVSFTIFMIVAASASVAIVNAIKAAHRTQQRVDAADVAQYVISEAIRNAETTDPQDFAFPGKQVQPVVGGNKDKTGLQISSAESFTYVEIIDPAATDPSGQDPTGCNIGTYFTVHVAVYQGTAIDGSGNPAGQYLARSDARVACPRV